MSLPVGYRQVEYLESSGTQYINTAFTPTNTTKVDVDVALLGFSGTGSASKWCCVFNSGAPRYGLFFGYDQNQSFASTIQLGWGNSYKNILYSFTEQTRFNVVIENASVYLNGNLIGSATDDTFTAGQTLQIFRSKSGESARVYSCKVYDNGTTLVRRLIPCLDNNDTPCMYDLVSGNTYYNAGTGSFTYGAVITKTGNLFAPYMKTHGVLPLGYTELQYIENTNTQFIDTGFTPNGNTSVELKAQRNEGEWGTFFGSRIGQSSNAYTIQFGSTNLALTSAYGNTAMVNGTTESDGLIHTYYMNKGNIDVDGVREITRATQTFTCPHSAYLFTMYMNAIPTSSRPMKLYYCKIWDNTTLVRHFIPARRNSDNVVGLYDIVNNVFYTNDGTGDFIAGPVVSELIRTKAAFVKDALPTGYIRLDYIENPDQNAYINTGIAPDNTTGFKVNMSVKNTTTDLYYLGCREIMQTDSRFGLGVYDGHTYMALGTYYSDVNNWTITSDTPFVAENNYKNSRVATMNGLYPVSVGTLSGITFTRNIYLFKSNMSTLQTTANCRVYECEITKGNSVVARFVPCLDNNGVACMYDTIRKQTFYSAGSSNFITNYIPPVVIPNGYTLLRYLESDGNQYINTDYIATQTTNIECDFMVTKHNSNLLNYVYGEYLANRACGLYVSSSTNVFGILYGLVDRNTSIPRVFNQKVHSILNSSNFIINETTENVGYNGTFTAPYTLCLFRGNGSTRPGMIGRIYYMLIREARSVVSRYLVPCLDDQNVPCMYDVITQETYYNGGTGQFEYGLPIPNNYTELFYIESSGTQYIDTGYYATNTSGINIDYAYSASGNAGLCGIYQGQSPRTDTLFITTHSGNTSGVMNLISQGSSITNDIAPTIGTKYNAKINYLNDGKLILNYTTTGNNGSNGVVSTRTIKLFCRDSSGSLSYTNARIYRCQISEGTNLVRDLLPCLDNNNVPCMYDAVGKQTYYNAGTGTFTYEEGIHEDLPTNNVPITIQLFNFN